LPKLGDGWGGAVDIIQAIAPGVSNPMKAFYGETEDARTGRTRFAYDGMGERLARAAGFTPTRERLANDAQRIVNMEERQDTAAQRAAIAAYLEERTPANRDRLRAAKVTTAQLRRALRERAKPGGALENAMRRTRRPENRQFMEQYAAM
jgi:predicted metalloendopeptidase